MELPPTMTVKVPGATRTVRLPLGPAVTVAKLHTSAKRFGIGLPPALQERRDAWSQPVRQGRVVPAARRRISRASSRAW